MSSVESIAIVGVGCHLPGNISSVEALIAALREGRDCVTEVPADRWDVNGYYARDAVAPGKTYVRHGGFVHDIDRFDAAFFGITDGEASRMDPQQRMALQTVWHALEHAGQSADELHRTSTGVFLSMMNTNGYAQLKSFIEGNDGVTGYDAVGDAMSIAAGRISHFLGLEGPCLAVDTACSGSMVAVHLACRSILLGECDSAIVVGVGAMLNPAVHIAFSKVGLMSRTGRCASFDEAADGYIRGEGCVAVLLRRESVALARKDRIVARIVSTAVNQDGRTPAITAPSQASQEKVVRQALRRAGVEPNDIGYVEAHGTGTPVGDPIEMRGIANVYGPGRSADAPLFVGSVKSNFGHLEAGAGLLGLVKAAVSLDQEMIFPSLHFHRLNPAIDLGTAPIQVAAAPIAWPRGERPRLAGVSSFGYSGTNAHAVLQEADRVMVDAPSAAASREMVVLSAKSKESLEQLVDRWTDFLNADSDVELSDIAFTTATGRTHLRHRLAVVGSSKAEMGAELRSWREGRSTTGVAAGQLKIGRKSKTAFVFGDHATSYAHMGRHLDQAQPVFAAAVDRVAAQMDAHLGAPLREVLFGASSAELLIESPHRAAALFAVEYALADLLSHWGIEPEYVVGVGAGEIAAACVAGVIDLEGAVRLILGGDSASVSRHSSPRLLDGIRGAIDAGCTLLIDVGPPQVLSPDLAATLASSKTRVVATLQPDGESWANLLETLATLYAVGAPVRTDRLRAADSRRRVSLPLYPFRRQRHWLYGELSADGTVALHPSLQDPRNIGSQAVPEDDGSAAAETQIESADQDAAHLYEVEWHPRALMPRSLATEGPGRWLVLRDAGGVGLAVQARLEARGGVCTMVAPAELSRDEFQQLLRDSFGPVAPRGVIHAWNLDAGSPDVINGTEELGCGSALHLVQALVQMEWSRAPRLWLLTRNSQAVGQSAVPVDPAQSPLWGLGKVIAIEHPELRCTKLDLSPEHNADEMSALVNELVANDVEDQIAWRNGMRHVARLIRREESTGESPASSDVFRLEIPKPGVLDHLTRRPTTREAPGQGQVEIQVSAAGLNFNDVLKALGMYPGMAEGAIPLGSECSGTVVAVGPGVDHLAVGDEVVAVAPGSFGSFVTAAAALVARKPASLSFEEAATIPIAFLTAVYALKHLGQLSEGDRVLIHAASGGVGLAAVQIAQQVGAEIFATAGTPEKRAFLESLGVPHVMDSRSTAFADEVLARTDGRGVDVVLNSLAGEGMLKSLEVMAPFGRFLEIGKRDIYENRELGLAPFRKQLAYFSIDLERLFAERPALGVKLFREVMQGVEAHTFTPLRLQVFPISEAVHAFREMAQARHIGKIIVSLDGREPKASAAEAEVVFRADQTYLITGGLGALGLAVATWMVEHGARHVALLGRHQPSAAARATLATWAQGGARVEVFQADLADRDQLSMALAEIDRTMPPLCGIVHAAGVQDDGVLLHLTRERFRTVMAPKVGGAWNLHTLTADRALDFFVLFSSAASLIGSPGQGNYAAGNAFLDALAHHRRAIGLPALSINWGAWSQVGLAAGAHRDSRISQLGMSITPRQGLDMLGRVIHQRAAQVAVMRVQVGLWQQVFPTAADWPFLEYLAREEAASGRLRSHESPLRKTLMALPTAQHRRALLESRLQLDLARTLQVNPTQVGLTEPLQGFGLDSLSAVELRNRWAEELGLMLSATLIWDHPTIAMLATYLVTQLDTPSDDVVSGKADQRERTGHAAAVAQIAALSDADAEALLLQKLSRLETKR